MEKNEQLKAQEQESRTEIRGADTKAPVSSIAANALFVKRTSILRSLEHRLSPLMRSAIEIKFAKEKEDMDELMKSAALAEAERARKKGVLDARFFRKKPLPV